MDMFSANKRKMFEYVLNDVVNQLTETQFTQFVQGPNDKLKNGEFELKNGSATNDNEEVNGLFSIDARIDACVISRGVMEKNGMKFEVDEKCKFPREIATKKSFKSIGTSTLQVELAGNPTIWEIEARVMPYRRLCTFDDENPEESAKGFYDIGLGRKFLEEVRKEEKNFESRKENEEARKWKIKLPETDEEEVN